MSDGAAEQFMSITGCDLATAQEHLAAANGSLELAMSSFFEIQQASSENPSQDTPSDDAQMSETPVVEPEYTGPRTLDGRPAPAAASTAPSSGTSTPKSSKSQGKKTGVSSFRDLISGGDSSQGAAQGSDDESDEDERKKPQNFFTGGEKSGLAVQDPNSGKGGPNKLVSSLLKKASEAGASPRAQAPPPQSSSSRFFGGGGNTLGSEDAPSVAVPDPNARPKSSNRMPGGLGGHDDEDDEDMDEDMGEVATRTLSFWSNGFSIEDGPLQSYDDPASKALLESLNRGTAPLSVLGIKFGQRVDLQIANRQQEEYKQPPPRPMRPFEGGGNRLGSPAPSIAGAGASQPATSSSSATPAKAAFTPAKTVFELDSTQPTTQIQIRLGSGERLTGRFNHTHTVGDIIRYINASQPAVAARPYVLQTTFPNRDLTDEKQTIKDANLLSSVVTMRYT